MDTSSSQDTKNLVLLYFGCLIRQSLSNASRGNNDNKK